MEQGKNIGHYTIIRQLGKGGMGEVYFAESSGYCGIWENRLWIQKDLVRSRSS